MPTSQSARYAVVLAVLLGCARPPAPARAPAPGAAPPAAAPGAVDPRAFDAYVGQYADSANAEMVLSVYRDGRRYYLQPTDNPPFELTPAAADTFAVPALQGRIAFLRDSAGRVVAARVRAGDHDFPIGRRVSDRPVIVRFTEMTRTDTMIPMRDGTRLHTVILAPVERRGPLPILLERTPYGVAHWDGTRVNIAHRALVADGYNGYIFVFQDIRGRFGSEGAFVMARPPRDAGGAAGANSARTDSAQSVDESTDAYDTIDWLVRHVPGNSGRVGVRGISYPGWLATMALRGAHPALRAASPQAPMGDLYRGDDFFHNGAFRLSYSYEFVTMLESSREMTDVKLDGAGDAYDWYLRLGPLANVNATRLHGRLPTWNAFVAHPNYDAFWRARAVPGQINRPGDRRVPTLVVGGRWDQEDPLGPLVTYAALERGDARGENTLVLGPWHHGQWSVGTGRRLGALDWGSATGAFFRDSVEAPWFAHHLKGASAPALPEALVFRSGANRWERYAQWPPRPGAAQTVAARVTYTQAADTQTTSARALYLREGGGLAFEAPPRWPTAADTTANVVADRYVADPANPVPYRRRPIGATFGEGQEGWWTWLAEDQRFVGDRADVLRWQTPPLTEDVTVTGDVVARLFASTTGTDADWVVKLVDVYPDTSAARSGADTAMAGYQLMVAGDILRGRFRRSLERPAPVRAGAVEPYVLTLRAVDHTFRRGHRIMVQVQSSWFPLYDRNPQTFVPNIFTARAGDFRAATHRVYRSARYPSRLELPAAVRP